MVKTYKNLYKKVCDYGNLFLAWKKARKGKTKRSYVIEFQENLIDNLEELQKELINQTYKPKPLKTFILRDPKTRKISKSAFRDRVVHHTLVRIIEPIFEKVFIYDSCANRIGKGGLFALERFDLFKRKVSENGKLASRSFDDNYVKGFCLKADIKHYFQEVSHSILIDILEKKIKDKKLINLIKKILINGKAKEDYSQSAPCQLDNKDSANPNCSGMPLGNLTSQFFANVYLNELDYFVKHQLKAKYYIRYVDDFVILHKNKEQLDRWKEEINLFLREKLKIELHPQKSKVVPLSRGVDFVGFRIFYYFKLLRKRNKKKILFKIRLYKNEEIGKEQLLESFQGWNAYAKWANSYNLRREIVKMIYTNEK